MDKRDLEILNQLFPDRRTMAQFTMVQGRKRGYWDGIVERWNEKDKRRELVTKCNANEFHVHRTSEAAVKCANKVAR